MQALFNIYVIPNCFKVQLPHRQVVTGSILYIGSNLQIIQCEAIIYLARVTYYVIRARIFYLHIHVASIILCKWRSNKQKLSNINQ